MSTPSSSAAQRPLNLQALSLLLDFSRSPLQWPLLEQTLTSPAVERALAMGRAMFRGEVVNRSENRPALHWLLRHPEAADRASAIDADQQRFLQFADRLHRGELPGGASASGAVTDLVQLGIGGSLHGAQTLVQACDPTSNQTGRCRVHFLSSADASAWQQLRSRLNPQSTAVVAVSKSFSTREVLLNLQRVRAWQHQALDQDDAAARLFAVTSAPDRAAAAGISASNRLSIPEAVGGRFSLWSAAGMAAAVTMGPTWFRRLLAGAHAMDRHFADTPAARNLPLLAALIDVLLRQRLGHGLRAVVSYGHALAALPEHLQQLEMESLGKPIAVTAADLIPARAESPPWSMNPAQPLLNPWVTAVRGTESEHALFQALHQSAPVVPAELIGIVRPSAEAGLTHTASLPQLLGQADALHQGDPDATGARRLPGKRPAVLLLARDDRPETLGTLLAFYEHKIVAAGALLDINPFDQFGVELGKQLARQQSKRLSKLSTDIGAQESQPAVDSSLENFLADAMASAETPDDD